MKLMMKYSSILFLVLAISGCDTPPWCPVGVYPTFQPSESSYPPQYSYDVQTDYLSIKMVPVNNGCLPRDVDIQLRRVPEGCRVYAGAPGWVKGRVLMPVSIYGVKKISPDDQSIIFDIYQGSLKRQTVKISVTHTPDIVVTVDGKRLSLSPPETPSAE